MSALPEPLECLPSPADRWVRRGAWVMVLSVVTALLWLGFFDGPAVAAPLSVPSADVASARSTR